MIASLTARVSAAMTLSVALHAFALFGIALVMPEPASLADMMKPLQVVLVNSKSKSRPTDADALAQANLDGGGNTAEDRQAKTPLPTISDDQQFTPEQVARRVAELEQESKRLMTRMKGDYTVAQPAPKKDQTSANRSGDDLVQRSLEIARLEAQISKNTDAYQKLPRRKYISARTQSAVEAQYIVDWRTKVERIGNLNYPEEARRQQIYGRLQLTVEINKDGSIRTIEVSRSSGHRILDAAAMRIVKLAAPYSPLPPEIAKDWDVLSITRTWTFTSADRLEDE
ncbi:MAG: energy transducer TonB [Gallionellales bacterium GWA2_59_43]|nr:MAG: energy transducer TonB [Gallionellales bacterium GWA2_59_43]